MEKILWRYMDIQKFYDMVKTSSLFFTFKNYFRDGCEGEDNLYKQKQRYVALWNMMELCKNLYDPRSKLLDIEFADTAEDRKQQILDAVKDYGSCYIVDTKRRAEADTQRLDVELNNIGNNCWTMEENFSKDMVYKFTDGFDYVAIKSSLENILNAINNNLFNSTHNDKRFYHNKVKYYDDYENANIEIKQPIENLYHMGSDWKAEKEYRFSISLRECFEEKNEKTRSITDEAIISFRNNKEKKGFRVPVNLDILNMEIHCSKFNQTEIKRILNEYNRNLSKYQLNIE